MSKKVYPNYSGLHEQTDLGIYPSCRLAVANLSMTTIAILGLIVLVGAGLRLWRLADVPVGLNNEEMSLAYTAWSVSETGKDVTGRFLPWVGGVFGFYHPPILLYLSVLGVRLFGISVWGVRLVSFTGGMMGLLMSYFLFLELGMRLRWGKWWAVVACGVLAVSPWHILLSREVNAGVWVIFGEMVFLWAALRFVSSKESWRYLFIAGVAVMGILGLGWLWWLAVGCGFVMWGFRGKLGSGKWWVGVVALVLIVGGLWYWRSLWWGESRMSEYEWRASIDLRRGWGWQAGEGVFSKFVHNKASYLGRDLLTRWVGAFSWERLVSSLNSGMGRGLPLVVMGEVVWGVLGAYCFVKRKEGLWLAGLVLGVIPWVVGQVSFELGVVAVLPLWVGLVTEGMQWGWRKFNRVAFLGVVGFGGWGLLAVGAIFAVPALWQDGRAAAYFGVMRVLAGREEKVLVSDRLGQPHLPVLFYEKFSPLAFRGEFCLTGEDKFGLPRVADFGKYGFRSFEWREERNKEQVVVGWDKEIDLAEVEANGVKYELLGKVKVNAAGTFSERDVGFYGENVYVVKIYKNE